MRSISAPHRLLVVALGVTLALGGLTACSRKTGDAGAGDPGGGTSAGGFGAGPENNDPAADGSNGHGTSSPGASSPGDGNDGNGNDAPTYPSDVKSYCTSAVTAWVKGDWTRVGQLAASGAATNFQHIEKGHDNNWKYIKGDGAAGSTYCILRNDHGDQLQVQVTNEKLGKPRAISDVVIEKTEYPSDPSSYASNFMGAWFKGNVQRMASYSSSSIAGSVSGKKALPDWSEEQEKEDKGDYWLIHESSHTTGDSITLKVKKNLGRSNGIIGTA